MTASPDPLRRLAAERGRLLAEIGVRPGDARWARLEAETLSALVTPTMSLRVPRRLARLIRRLRRLS